MPPSDLRRRFTRLPSLAGYITTVALEIAIRVWPANAMLPRIVNVEPPSTRMSA